MLRKIFYNINFIKILYDVDDELTWRGIKMSIIDSSSYFNDNILNYEVTVKHHWYFIVYYTILQKDHT